MPSNYSVESNKFYNQYRNGDAFSLNLTEFNTRLQGNEGEKVKLIQNILVFTITNEFQAIDITFNELAFSTYCTFSAPLIDWGQEGYYNGASLSIDIGGTTVVGTCEGVSGSGNYQLKIDSVGRTNILAAGITDGYVAQSIVVRISNSPTYVNYKYGLNPNSSTSPNYINELDYEQSYQLNGITVAFQPMVWVGSQIGGNYGDVEIKFNATSLGYIHSFTVEHIFKIPDYKDGEITNLDNLINPTNLDGANSLKYGNGYFFGGTIGLPAMSFEDIGIVGSVGYKNENFNGFVNNYGIENVVITNASATGTLEGTLANTVTFDIKKDIGAWVGGEDVILTHKKLPTALEYQAQNTAFDTIWIWENLRQTEGVAAVAGTIFSAFTATIDGGDPTLINVSVVLTYSAGQQALIFNTSSFLLSLTVATQNLSNPDTVDRVDLVVDRDVYSINSDELLLITKWTPQVFFHWDYDSGTQLYTNFDGWDGDLLGISFKFDTDVTRNAVVKDFKLHLAIDNGVDYHPLITIPIAITKLGTTPVTTGPLTYNYQILNKDFQASFNLPSTEQLNRLELGASIPATATPTQTWAGKVGFRVAWRDWIANLNIPTSFIDYTKPNDNLNQKSSNYSGVGGYEVKAIVELLMGSDGTDTTYLLESDPSSILDFDDPGAGTFSANTFFYDDNSDLTDNVFIDQNVRIEIEFDHTLGTLLLADLWGRIWIEAQGTSLQPWELSTDKDFTNINNPLQPTDTLLSGNIQFVEVISVSNKVTLICQTNRDNLTENLVYNVYGRLGSSK